jgi:cytochrome P450
MYPLHQEQARKEVLSVLGPSEDPTVDTLSRMPFLSACIKEAHRMNNPSNFPLPRISPFNSTKVGGLSVPPKTPIIFNIAAMHRNESSWSNVEDYDPLRFSLPSSLSINNKIPEQKEKEDTSNNHNAWVPFGVGPRQCPAKSFSLYEQRVMAATMLREYTWSLPENSIHSDGIRNKFAFTALNSPRDLEIRFVKRR